VGFRPKPWSLFEKSNAKTLGKRIRACKKSGQARCACRGGGAESPTVLIFLTFIPKNTQE